MDDPAKDGNIAFASGRKIWESNKLAKNPDPLKRADAGASALRRFGPLLGVAAAILAAWVAGIFDYFSLSALIMHRVALAGQVSDNLVLALSVYCVLYAALVAISFPGASLLTVVAGFLFGAVIAGIATTFAATAGAVAIFLIARSSFGDFLERRASGFVGKLVEGFKQDSFSYLLSLRLTPVFPFWVINIVPAMLNMKTGPYALATFLGIIPGTFAYAYVGAGLGSVIAAQEQANPGCAPAGTCVIDLESLVTPQLLLGMLALGLIALTPVLLKRFGFKFGSKS